MSYISISSIVYSLAFYIVEDGALKKQMVLSGPFF